MKSIRQVSLLGGEMLYLDSHPIIWWVCIVWTSRIPCFVCIGF